MLIKTNLRTNKRYIVTYLISTLLCVITFLYPFAATLQAEEPSGNAVADEDYDVYIPEDKEPEEFLSAMHRSIADLSEEEKMSDYESFWEIMEESFPMFEYLLRQGVDAQEIKERYALGVSAIDNQGAWQALYANIVAELLGDLNDVGHLSVVYPGFKLLNSDYQIYTYLRKNSPEDNWVDMMAEFFDNPHCLGYYNLSIEKRDNDEVEPYYEVPNNLYIEHHPEADWSYINVYSFLNRNPDDEKTIHEFFKYAEEEQIGNIIIDLRENEGGYNDYWMKYFVAPNISELLEVENFGLYKDSKWNKDFLDYYDSSSYEAQLSELEEYADAPSVIIAWERYQGKLPRMEKLNKDDSKSLDSIFRETLRVAPSYTEPLFSGKFWLLSGPRSYSASEYFLSFAKRTGFATIVGEESSGDGSCVITVYNALPESGLIIRYNTLYGLSPEGEPSEEVATKPDYPLAPGEDALYKALDLIAEAQKIAS